MTASTPATTATFIRTLPSSSAPTLDSTNNDNDKDNDNNSYNKTLRYGMSVSITNNNNNSDTNTKSTTISTLIMPPTPTSPSPMPVPPTPTPTTTISSYLHLKSPGSATILNPIHCFSLLPEGPPTPLQRQQLARELDEINEASTEARQAYTAVHGAIQEYQQLVLSTHAKVAAAKVALVQARSGLVGVVSDNGGVRGAGKQGRTKRRHEEGGGGGGGGNKNEGGEGSVSTSRSSYFPPCATIGASAQVESKPASTSTGGTTMVSTLSSSLNMFDTSPFIPSSTSPLSPSSPPLSRSYSYTSSTLSTNGSASSPSSLPSSPSYLSDNAGEQPQLQLQQQQEQEQGQSAPIHARGIDTTTTNTTSLLASPTLLAKPTAAAKDLGERGGRDRAVDSAEESGSAINTSTTNASSSTSSFDTYSYPSLSSDSSVSSDSSDEEEEEEDAQTRLDKLGQQHAILGGQLSQLLRDKAQAEACKKRLNDGLLRAKARIKAIEHKLEE